MHLEQHPFGNNTAHMLVLLLVQHIIVMLLWNGCLSFFFLLSTEVAASLRAPPKNRLTVVTSTHYPNGQPCNWGSDMLLATRLAASRFNFTLDVHEASGIASPALIANVSSSISTSDAVLGLAWSNVALNVMRQIQFPSGTPALGAASATDLDTYSQFFRVGYRDSDAASVLVRHVAETLGWRRLALLGAPDNSFGLGGIIGVNRSVAASSGIISIVAYEPIQIGASDAALQAAVQSAAAAAPDGFIVSAPGPDTRAVLRAASATNRTARTHGRPLWLATEKVELPESDPGGRRGAMSYVCYAPSKSSGGVS